MPADCSQTMTLETGFGPCALTWTARGLARVRLLDAAPPRSSAGPLPEQATVCAALLERYFNGNAVDFDPVPLDFDGISAEMAAIYRALRGIRWGQATTYGALAAAVGMPGAARVVGVAMARNPWPVIVPCHRVLAAGGRLGGFSAPGGTRTKERLLALEGIDYPRETPLLPGLFLSDPS